MEAPWGGYSSRGVATQRTVGAVHAVVLFPSSEGCSAVQKFALILFEFVTIVNLQTL